MEFLLAILYVAHQTFGGNLDLFYILAALLLLKDFLFFRYQSIIGAFKFLLPIIIIVLLQILVLENLTLEKSVIYIGKIYLCLYLLNIAKNNFHRINITKLYKCIAVLLTLLFIIGLFVKTDTFWIFNDFTNKYLTTRLKLLYIEPSELSFHAAVSALFILFYNDNYKKLFTGSENLINLFIILILMTYSGGLGAIILLLLTVIIIFSRIHLKKSGFGKKIKYIYILIVMIPIFLIFISRSENPITLRLQSIMNGTDSSFNYRLLRGFNGMKACLSTNPYLGIGFGNLNTEYYQYFLLSYGLVSKIANSFMYAIAEGGFLFLFYLSSLFLYMYKKVKNKNNLKYALLIFIFLYQIAGGYITNPINWIIYGVILSDSTKGRSEVLL